MRLIATDAWRLTDGHKDHTAVLKQVKQLRYRLRCGLGLATESCVRIPQEKGRFCGRDGISQSIVKYREYPAEPQLFARWQQR